MKKASQFKKFMDARLSNLDIFGQTYYTKSGTAVMLLSNTLTLEYGTPKQAGRVSRLVYRIKSPTIAKLKQALNKGISAILEADRNPIHALREALCLRATKVEKKIDSKKVERMAKATGYSDDYCNMTREAIIFWNAQLENKTILKG